MRFSLVYSCLLPNFLALVPIPFLFFIYPRGSLLISLVNDTIYLSPYALFDLDFSFIKQQQCTLRQCERVKLHSET